MKKKVQIALIKLKNTVDLSAFPQKFKILQSKQRKES